MVNEYIGKAIGKGMADNMWENNTAGVKDEIESLIQNGDLELEEGQEPQELLEDFWGSVMGNIFKEAAENMDTSKIFENEDKASSFG